MNQFRCPNCVCNIESLDEECFLLKHIYECTNCKKRFEIRESNKE